MRYSFITPLLLFGTSALALLDAQPVSPSTNVSTNEDTTTVPSNATMIDNGDLVSTVYALAQSVENLALSVQYLASTVTNSTGDSIGTVSSGANGTAIISGTFSGNNSYLVGKRRAKST